MNQKYTNNSRCEQGRGEDPPTCKMGKFFQIPLAITMSNSYIHFPIKWSFGRNSQTKTFTFYNNKNEKVCLRVSSEAPFYWKLLKIGTRSAKDIRNDVPIFQDWGSAPASPTRSFTPYRGKW